MRAYQPLSCWNYFCWDYFWITASRSNEILPDSCASENWRGRNNAGENCGREPRIVALPQPC